MNVSGYVYDSGGQALAGAIIQDNKGNATQTDDNGFYSIETTDDALLIASYFTTSSNQKIASPDLDFRLPTIMKNEVTVSAERPLPDLLSLILFCALAYVILYGLYLLKWTSFKP